MPRRLTTRPALLVIITVLTTLMHQASPIRVMATPPTATQPTHETVTDSKAMDRIWSFRNDVLPVLTKLGCNSGACHGAGAGKGGLKLTLRGYGPEIDHDVLTRQARGRRIDRSVPARSLMLLKPTGVVEHGGGRIIDVGSIEYRILSEWIAQGAPPPYEHDPILESIVVIPASLILRPEEAQPIRVEARYSDGRSVDVTQWAKFETTNETVVVVDASGVVTVKGHGEASISVWFNNQVELITVTSPPDRRLDLTIFASAPRVNPIDDHNLAKLRALGIPPSPPTDDATFLRRAYLDVTGTLPPLEVVREFSRNSDPDKRSKLIDRLLDSAEFVDYWTYRWSDVFLVSTRELPTPAMWAFSRFIRESVEKNLPWDEFARRIITARGSTLTNGAANFFVLHRDPIELTENAAVAFMGLAMTCARCHNHPMEKWTQDQYYGLANLFARVRLKDGASSGEVIVTPDVEGDVLHPRRNVPMPPQPLDGIPLPLDSRADRRVAFADWLADPANPYFDKALVNRVWANFFGKGLIDPADDLRATNPASDSALLAWLIEDFRSHGRDVRHLIRTIMNSATYTRSSEPVPGNETDTRYLSHFPLRRLSAEVMLDAISQVTEVPTAFPGYPTGWRALQLPDATVVNPFLDAFGRPARETTCSCERSDDPSMSQALHLANGTTLNDKLRSEHGVVARLSSTDFTEAEILEHLFLTALARKPSDAERQGFLKALPGSTVGREGEAYAAARREAIEDLVWAVLTSEEFLFNH